MDVEYRSQKIRKCCEDASIASRQYGLEMAEKLQQRIQEFRAFDSVEQLIRFRIGRCHELKGNRKSQYAVDLVQPFRLVFEKKGNDIQIVKVMEIVDYH